MVSTMGEVYKPIMSNKQKIVRISPLNAVVCACFFRDAEKAGKAMLDFLNAVLKHVGE